MAEIDVIFQGFGAGSSEGSLSLCGITLIRGEHLTLVDVGYPGRRQALLDRLQQRGIERTDIDRVVLTHAHWDHTLNTHLFPNAEVILSYEEHEYVQQIHPLDLATPRYTPDLLRLCKQVTTVRDGEELEPTVRVMTVPGHSPGSLAVLVETPEGIVGMTGDALPSRRAATANPPTAGLIFYDEEEGERSARRILDTCKIVYPGHDRAFSVEGNNIHYIQPQSITFTNPPRDEDGTVHAALDNTPPAEFQVTVFPSARAKAK